MINSALPYIIISIYCIIYSCTILFKLNSSIGSEHEIKVLRIMIYTFLGMIVSDIITVLCNKGIFENCDIVNSVSNATSCIFVLLGCYYYYRFVEDRIHPNYVNHKTLMVLINIPVFIACVLDVCSIFTGWVFYIDADGQNQVGKLFIFHAVIDYIYLLIPTVSSLFYAFKTRSRQQREEYITYALYMIPPLISGFLETVITSVPLLAINIFLVIHFLFISIQDMQIYNDALTGLNNRRRLNQFLEERIKSASEENEIVVYMIDINKFKSINDNYGHVEGDKALKLFAKVAKMAALKYNAFVARYGGDEFCIVTENCSLSREELKNGLNEMLLQEQLQNDFNNGKYKMSISIGYATCINPDNDINKFISRADKALYKEKMVWHKVND